MPTDVTKPETWTSNDYLLFLQEKTTLMNTTSRSGQQRLALLKENLPKYEVLHGPGALPPMVMPKEERGTRQQQSEAVRRALSLQPGSLGDYRR